MELLSPPLPQTSEDGTEQLPLQIDEGSPLDNLAVSPSRLNRIIPENAKVFASPM